MDIIDELERWGNSSELRWTEGPSTELLSEVQKIQEEFRNVCCGIYAPEDDPPVPVEEVP